MCTGTEMGWITAALMASSAAAKYAGDKKSQTAMDTMRQLERDRQEAHQKTANTLLGDTLETSSATTAEQDIADAAGKRQAAYQAAQTPSAPAQDYAASQLGVASGNKVVGGSIASGQRSAENYGNTVSKAMSRIGGYTDQNLARNIFNNRQLNAQANVGNFMQGSLGVLPVELDAANRKGDNMRTLGQILGAAGQVTGMMAATGVNPFAAAEPAAETAAAAGSTAATGSGYNIGDALNAHYADAVKPENWLTVPGTTDSWNTVLSNGSFLSPQVAQNSQYLNALNQAYPIVQRPLFSWAGGPSKMIK